MLKKVLTVLAIAFAAYYLITAPEAAANSVKDAIALVALLFDRVIRFFTELS